MNEDEEEKRALEAFRAIREGGRRGGESGTGKAKRRPRAHYEAASRAAAIARARSKGLELFEVTSRDGSLTTRVGATDGVAAKHKAAEKLKVEASSLRAKLIK